MWSVIRVLCVLLAFVHNSLPASAYDQEVFELSIVHVNDFHARFEETGASGGVCKAKGKCYGGVARLATESSRLLNSTVHSLFLNAGDSFQGTPWYNLYHWQVTAEFMSLLRFDAHTLGNHEFDDGVQGCVPYVQNLNSPMVVSNINASLEPDLDALLNKSLILERGGRRIGIVGVITTDTPKLAQTGKLIFLDAYQSAEMEAAKLKQQNVNIIILLSHAGIDTDRSIAKMSENIDIIVGGHSHTLLHTGNTENGESAEDVYPIIITQKKGRKVAIVQAGAYSKYIGFLATKFNTDGELLEAFGNTILMDSSIPEDRYFVEKLKPWKKRVDAWALTPIATTKVFLNADNRACEKGECNIMNLFTDAMVYENVKYANPGYWTKASISFMNGIGIRTSLEETNNGVITNGDLLIASPFQNTIDTIDILGSDILDVLEISVSNPVIANGNNHDIIFKGFIHFSGLKVIYNISNPVGRRVIQANALCNNCRIPHFQPIDQAKWYKVALPSFLAEGGGYYNIFLKRRRNYEIGRIDNDIYEEYMTKISPITTEIDGRITIVH